MTARLLLFIPIFILFLAAAVFIIKNPSIIIPEKGEKKIKTETAVTEKTVDAPLAKAGAENIKGVWVATVYNIDFPLSSNLTADELRAQTDEITATCAEMNVNTIFFQVRPSADAFYKSSIFPTSRYLTGTEGAPLPGGFDPLAYFIESAHKKGISLHAWINPLRITRRQDDALSEKNPAVKHPEFCMTDASGKTYFNPGIPGARRLITDGVREIAENYSIDGIHFDDYFYPESAVDDDASYAEYGGDASLGDYRRKSVSLLIEETNRVVKSINKDIAFGVSPQGIYKNFTANKNGKTVAIRGNQGYYTCYADSLEWMEKKYVDYICPQIYWDNAAENSPFDALADWWSTQSKRTGVPVLIGHALYKTADANSARAEFGVSEIARQAEYARSLPGFGGNVLFSYSDAARNKTQTAGIFSG